MPTSVSNLADFGCVLLLINILLSFLVLLLTCYYIVRYTGFDAPESACESVPLVMADCVSECVCVCVKCGVELWTLLC